MTSLGGALLTCLFLIGLGCAETEQHRRAANTAEERSAPGLERATEPPTLRIREPRCAPSADGPRWTAQSRAEPPFGHGERLELHDTGYLRVSYTSAWDDGSVCPVSKPSRDFAVCLDASAVERLASLADNVAAGEMCIMSELAQNEREWPGPCGGSGLAVAMRSALHDALAQAERAACTAPGLPCGIAIESVILQHDHFPTAHASIAQLWLDGRWRCEWPASELPAPHENRCGGYAHVEGRLPASEAQQLYRWLVAGQSDAALASAPSEPLVARTHRDFLRTLIHLGPEQNPARYERRGDAEPVLITRTPVHPRAFSSRLSTVSLALAHHTDAGIRARWNDIAAQLDARCAVPTTPGGAVH
ncbi:MAG: hypothetical protein AAF645_16390 [Myxococcota bacterium]